MSFANHDLTESLREMIDRYQLPIDDEVSRLKRCDVRVLYASCTEASQIYKQVFQQLSV